MNRKKPTLTRRKRTISPIPKVFAVGDLHLPGGTDKPMDVFGGHWEGHFLRIAEDWRERVRQEDIVLIPGDISWAMQLSQAQQDLDAIGALPGRKILIRGNHDYWWGSISKLRAALSPGMYALQNDALMLDGLVFCGSRGWTAATEASDDEDRKIYLRELGRMELSLQAAIRLSKDVPPIVLTHYPPVEERGGVTPMSALFTRYGVRDVVYGHLHGAACERAFRGEVDGVRYHSVSCDGLGFRVYELPPVDSAPKETPKE